MAGETGPTTIRVAGIRQAILTDLLERDQKEIPIANEQIHVDLPPNGYRAIRLFRERVRQVSPVIPAYRSRNWDGMNGIGAMRRTRDRDYFVREKATTMLPSLSPSWFQSSRHRK